MTENLLPPKMSSNFLPPEMMDDDLSPKINENLPEETLSYSEIDEKQFFSSTFVGIPSNLSVIKQSEIPFTINIQPDHLKTLNVPISEEEIVRCTACKSYINPFVEVIPPGLKWKCNICFTTNELSLPFHMVSRSSAPASPKFSLVGNATYNHHTYARTELRSTVYELHAPSNYSVRTPSSTVICFMIEATYESLSRGVLQITVRSILDNIDPAMYDPRARMMFIFFNAQIYILNTDNSLTVISDTTVIPFFQEDNYMFALSQKPNLSEAERMFAESKSSKNNFGDALKIAHTLLKNNGGSIVAFLNTSSNFGPGLIEENDKETIQCKSVFYQEMAGALIKSIISVSYFLFPKPTIELPTLSVLSKSTGGLLFYYPNFDGGDPVFTTKLHSDVRQLLALNFSHDCVCRIRTSRDVFIKEYNGSLNQKTFDLLSFPNAFPPHTFSIDLEIVDNIIADGISLQIALMRTTKKGNRMIRVINIQIPQHMDLFYNYIDPYAITRSLAVKAFYYESRNKASGISYLYSSLLGILKAYKKNTNSFSMSKLPENLNLLPMLILALSKSIPLRPVNYMPVDYKIFYMYLMSISYPSLIDTIIYPTLLPLHTEEIYPQNLTIDCLETRGIYLLDTGFTIFFFIGKDCPKEVENLLFDSDIPSGRIFFDPPRNDFSDRVVKIISELREERVISPFYILIKDNNDETTDRYRKNFFSYLYEDHQHNLHSIKEYFEKLESSLS
ncbi:Protein transport protein SEC24 [Nosema granulosis]|uniref:Protein transport protein SEC24 n=1 Tax=Nosema granulosis TaxID=83296 RepID=A0A9P6GZI4_9MICR|nr:Protein transport protein SEC24 [Nosema granulosis]